MSKPFDVLRQKMSPAAQNEAAKKTKKLVAKDGKASKSKHAQ